MTTTTIPSGQGHFSVVPEGEDGMFGAGVWVHWTPGPRLGAPVAMFFTTEQAAWLRDALGAVTA